MDGGFETPREHPVRVKVVHHLVHQGHVQRPLAGGKQTTVEAGGCVSKGVQDDVKPEGRRKRVLQIQSVGDIEVCYGGGGLKFQ